MVSKILRAATVCFPELKPSLGHTSKNPLVSSLLQTRINCFQGPPQRPGSAILQAPCSPILTLPPTPRAPRWATLPASQPHLPLRVPASRSTGLPALPAGCHLSILMLISPGDHTEPALPILKSAPGLSRISVITQAL